MNEEKKKVFSGKNIILIIIMILLIIGICTNVYAKNHGYGNVFSMIKTKINGEEVVTEKENVLIDGVRNRLPSSEESVIEKVDKQIYKRAKVEGEFFTMNSGYEYIILQDNMMYFSNTTNINDKIFSASYTVDTQNKINYQLKEETNGEALQYFDADFKIIKENEKEYIVVDGSADENGKIYYEKVENKPVALMDNIERKDENAVMTIKKALIDEEWVKDNIYIKENEVNNEGYVANQELNFIVCKNNVIVINVVAGLGRKTVLVTYADGKIKVEKIAQGHTSHGLEKVDPNKCVVKSEFMHMGDNSEQLFSINDGKVKSIGKYRSYEESENTEIEYYITENDTKTTKAEYERYKASLNEEQYSFVSIGTKLTKENIEKFVK